MRNRAGATSEKSKQKITLIIFYPFPMPCHDFMLVDSIFIFSLHRAMKHQSDWPFNVKMCVFFVITNFPFSLQNQIRKIIVGVARVHICGYLTAILLVLFHLPIKITIKITFSHPQSKGEGSSATWRNQYYMGANNEYWAKYRVETCILMSFQNKDGPLNGFPFISYQNSTTLPYIGDGWPLNLLLTLTSLWNGATKH